MKCSTFYSGASGCRRAKSEDCRHSWRRKERNVRGRTREVRDVQSHPLQFRPPLLANRSGFPSCQAKDSIWSWSRSATSRELISFPLPNCLKRLRRQHQPKATQNRQNNTSTVRMKGSHPGLRLSDHPGYRDKASRRFPAANPRIAAVIMTTT